MAGASQGLHDHLDLWAGAKEGWDGQGGETGKRVRTHLNPMRVALWRGLVYERGHNPAHKVWGVLILREQIARFPCSVHTDKGAVGMERARSNAALPPWHQDLRSLPRPQACAHQHQAATAWPHAPT